ncbi:hypothetical protein [Planctomycetes bacterium Poly30]
MRLTRPAAIRPSDQESHRVRPQSGDQPGSLSKSLSRVQTLGLAISTLGLAASLSGCTGAAGTEFSGDLFIESCSLACTDGASGAAVSCSIVDVTENQEISVLFSEPIDPATVNASSLQVIDVDNGTTPDGLRFVDPLNPNRVIFRPTVSFETGVNFSFLRNRSYEILIPGVAQGDAGPYIRSIVGRPNQSRLLCTVDTSQGVSDTVPGDPSVEVFVDTLTLDTSGNPILDGNGNPVLTRKQLGADFATKVENIALNSNVYFEFNELMNLPTVANNQFMTSPFIAVELDGDGNLATAGSDRSRIEGNYTVTVDQELLTTSLVFVPSGGFPAASVDDPMPALITVRIPASVVDIVQRPVTTATGGGTLVGVAERIEFESVFIPSEAGESFDLSAGTLGSQEAENITGALWGGGVLSPGVTGGTGRHGSLRIATGQTVILNTDSQVFPIDDFVGLNVIGNQDAMGDYPRTITETSGVFEFTTLQIAPSGTLMLTGSKPARILVRGEMIVEGSALIDLSGTSAPVWNSLEIDNDDYFAANPDDFPAGGPNAGPGGLGGDRADLGGTDIVPIGGVANPNSVRNGRPGVGIGLGTLSGDPGRGNGGAEFPVALPASNPFGYGLNATLLAGLNFNIGPDPLGVVGGTVCSSAQLGGVGSGGGYALPGGVGSPNPEFPTANFPVNGQTAPGDTFSQTTVSLAMENIDNINYSRRILRWNEGHLQGGASGGGGGNHTYGTLSGLTPVTTTCMGDFIVGLTTWHDHSAGSGGGAGGAVELLAGRSINLAGAVNASGGNGGSAISVQQSPGSFAMPGGGGSGGAVRVRAPQLSIGANARINVSGGAGGIAPWANFATGQTTIGGDGSPGLIRLEDGSGTISFMGLAGNVLPSGLESDVLKFLSVAPGYVMADPNNVVTLRPDSISGAGSCWFRPPGPFQSLGAREDDPMSNTVESKGWTMDVVTATGSRPFRGSDDGSPSWEEEHGNLLGYDLGINEDASPIVVRFQGARSIGQTLLSPCDINIDEFPNAQIQTGSLTPWVSHPADLEQLLTSSGAPFTPTMIRYIVIFDKTIDPVNSDTPGQILIDEQVIGVDNLRIEADPR